MVPNTLHASAYRATSSTTATVPPSRANYFARDARAYDSPGSYADWEAETTHDTVTEWHHTLGDIISAVAGAGLRVEFVHEHDTIPFQRYGALVADGVRFRYPDQSARLPLMYSLAASAPAR